MLIKFRPKTPLRLRDKIYRSYRKPRVLNSNGQNSTLKAEFGEILGVLTIEWLKPLKSSERTSERCIMGQKQNSN